MPGKDAVDEIRAWGPQQMPVMGQSEACQDRRVRAAIGSVSALATTIAAVSAKPGLLY